MLIFAPELRPNLISHYYANLDSMRKAYLIKDFPTGSRTSVYTDIKFNQKKTVNTPPTMNPVLRQLIIAEYI